MPQAHGSQRGPHLHQQRHSLLPGRIDPNSRSAGVLPAGASPGTGAMSTVLTVSLLGLLFSTDVLTVLPPRSKEAGQRLGLSFLGWMLL